MQQQSWLCSSIGSSCVTRANPTPCTPIASPLPPHCLPIANPIASPFGLDLPCRLCALPRYGTTRARLTVTTHRVALVRRPPHVHHVAAVPAVHVRRGTLQGI